jgi:autotransporter translocation and assembly factor TamB
LRRVVIWLVRAVAVLLALVLVTLLTLRTGSGRRALVRLALPLVNRALAGHVKLSSLEGDFTRVIVIHDLKIDDAEGVQALYARRISVRFDLAALMHHVVQIDDLDVDGAQLLVRHLRDGRVNFAALARATKTPATVKTATGDPPRLVVTHLRLRFDGGYDPPPGHETHALERPRGTFDIEGSLSVHGGDVTAVVSRLVSDARDPLAAHVELSGRLKVDPPDAAGHVELTFGAIALTVAVDGAELGRIDPRIKAAGRWKVSVTGAGPLAALRAHVVVMPPKGTLTVDGTLARGWPGVKWTAHAVAAGISPADDWRGLDAGGLDFDVTAMGDGGVGSIAVARLALATGDLRLAAHGKSDFTGDGDAEVIASAGDLRRLAAFGLSGFGGRASVTARLQRGGGPRQFDGQLHARHLEVPGATIGAVDVAWKTRELAGTVELAARALRTPSIALDRVTVAARSDGRRLDGQIDLAQPGAGARIILAATARRARGRLAGADVTISGVDAFSRAGRFQLARPAHVRLSGTLAAPALDGDLSGVRLTLRGRTDHAGGGDRFTADVMLDAPDLSRVDARLGGRLHLAARIERGARLGANGVLHGEALRYGTLRIGAVAVTLRGADLAGAPSGSVELTASALRAPGVIVDELVVAAHANAQTLALALHARGPAQTVALALDGRALRRGAASIFDGGGAELTLRELTIAAAGSTWKLAAPATLRLGAPLFTVERLRLGSGAQLLALDGKWRRTSGAVDVTLTARDVEPASFARLVGVKDALVDTTLNGRVHVSGTTRAPIMTASFKAESDKTIAWYGLAFNALKIDATAERRAISLRVDAWGTGSGRLLVEARGLPEWQGDTLTGLEVTLQQLRLSANEHVWQIGSACHARLALVTPSAVTVDSCKLFAGVEEIALAGRVPLGDGALEATLSTHALDLRQLGALFAPGHKELPETRFDTRVHAGGTRRAPVIDLELQGHGSQIDEGLPENVDYRVRARYADGRVAGEVSARQLGTSLGVGARFDLPLSFAQADDRPLSLELVARPVPFFKLRASLPPAIAGLHGFFTLRVRASGTTRHPLFTAELHAPSWNLDNLANNNTDVNLSYDGTLLRANSVTSFAATTFLDSLLHIRPRRNHGTIKLELKTPVDLARLLSRPREVLTALGHSSELTATAEIKGVELESVPLQVLGIATPFTSGRVDGALSMAGSLDAPIIHADLRAADLSRPGVVDALDAVVAFAFERNRAHASGELRLRHHLLASFKGEAALDAKLLFDPEHWREHWRDGALNVDFVVPPFELAGVRGMQPRLRLVSGRLHGDGALRGTFERPELTVALAGSDVELGGDRFNVVKVDLHYGARRFRVSGVAEQSRGGRLDVDASWSRASDAPLAISAEAHQLDLGFLASVSQEISSLTGTLDGNVSIGGTGAHPQPEGTLTVDGASLGLRGKAQIYRDGRLALGVHDARADVALHLAAGDGTFTASGHAGVDGLQPTSIDLAAKAQRFALVYGTFATVLDADFALHGARGAGQWTGAVDLHRGTIDLPDLSGAAALEPAGELADLTFADQRADRVARPAAGKGHWVMARITGPLRILSHELTVEVTSDLAVTVAPGRASASGVVSGGNGSVDLFGRRYTLVDAAVRFAGPVDDPAVSLRATRRVGNATLVITVSGSAKLPRVALSMEPPSAAYRQADLVGLVLSGTTRGARALSFGEVNHRVGGLLANVIVQKIREQLADVLPAESLAPVERSRARFALSPLEVGRYVSDRVYLSYEHQFGTSLGRSAANANESQIKVRLPHGGELYTAVGDAGVAGVYLYWTIHY